jgi:hypothetical protein
MSTNSSFYFFPLLQEFGLFVGYSTTQYQLQRLPSVYFDERVVMNGKLRSGIFCATDFEVWTLRRFNNTL